MRDKTLFAILCSAVLTLVNCTTTDEPNIDSPDDAIAHCIYTNQFSTFEECREYTGANWTLESAEDDCNGQQDPAFGGEGGCPYDDVLGRCILDGGSDDVYRIVFPGPDDENCASLERGCEIFGGGAFVPDVPCGGTGDDDPDGIGTGGTVFVWPTETCALPLEGEPEGESGGDVCTFNAISACTEEGRRFEDYASCDDVLTQRPYWAAPPRGETPANDPRLDDEVYMAEVKWVADQIDACGCVCCHATRAAPETGTSQWYTDAEGVWVDTMSIPGMALGAGWVDSSSFGAYPPSMNNGFDRETTGFPTTDIARMRSFFANELASRGYNEADFVDEPPFGGPLYTQAIFEPSSCENDEGVKRDGTVEWSGGKARYVYVLEEGSANPGAPPNLDMPADTIWRVQVPADKPAFSDGISYGTVSGDVEQWYPTSGAPSALIEGETYYLYVLTDVGIPITRCLFEY